MKYLIKGKLYDPIKCGDEKDWCSNEEGVICGDCGCGAGFNHISGCDIERCPACGMQMISCGCQPVYELSDEQANHVELVKDLIKKQEMEREIQDKELEDFLKYAKNKKTNENEM